MMTATAQEGFEVFFRTATGYVPYDYQRRLGLGERAPDLVEVPTGAGKTQAVLAAWLFARRRRGVGPRRLVYALPMRTLVEQTVEVARGMRERLGLSDEELPVHVLMGGELPASFQGWREHPESEQILVGTVDMLLSRALNRGYGESRFQWPVSFGFLNSDCWWVLDEVQLMGPARSTSAQLHGLRAKLGTARACETTWMSATIDRDALVTVDRPRLGAALTLSDRDRSGEELSRRLNAVKRLERVDVSGHPAARLPRVMARAVLERHAAGTRAIVVLNRVDLAQAVLRALRQELKASGPDTVLLHSRFRPPERAARMAEALAPVAGDGPGRIVVSTQVIEAGVDTSAALLATETAPFSALVQRWGRCNRAGELAEGVALWLDRGELDPRAAAPYEAADLSASRAALLSLVGSSVSPAMLERISVPESRPQSAVLRRRDLVDLFDTSPDLSGMDVDVSRFIRDEDERTVSVFFRDLEPGNPVRDPAAQPYAQRHELVEVPIAAVAVVTRVAWVFDHVDGVWRSAGPADRYPGATLMLRAGDGGYDEQLGWTGAASDRPAPISPPAGAPEAIGDERQSFSREWRTLADHLADAEAEALELVGVLGSLDLPDDGAEALCGAAALHDVGKAHPAFQAMLLSQLDEGERKRRADTLWAKSALAGGRHVRPHFRHELASALALLAVDASLDAVGRPSELAVYLVGSHHGRVRMSIRPAPEERPPPDRPDASRFALGVAEGDELAEVSTPWGVLPPTRLQLRCMELGGSDARGRSWRASCAAASTSDRFGSRTWRRCFGSPIGGRVADATVFTLRLTGCRSRPLLSYLKAVGVLRTVARQGDSQARGRWAAGTFELQSTLDAAALESFYLTAYRPTPVVSPWNGSSGFFPKDNKEGFDAIEASDDERLTPFREAIDAARSALVRLGIAEKPGNKQAKTALLQELRATLPDDALEWFDAAVVVVGMSPAYPPLLGSGGNDGHFDFANNYARAVAHALVLGAQSGGGEQAAGWLGAALWERPAPLEKKLSLGHFFRDSSPSMSPLGEAESLGNPWDLVLGVEGALLLAAGAARRHGAAIDPRLIAPFTVRASGAGYGSAVPGESGRAELWLPLWGGFAGLPELETLAREARAQVGRRSARTGLDFARAAAELGVARGIEAFERYAVLERAGQSSLAVPAGRIEVRPRPAVTALRTLDPWLERVLRHGHGKCPAAHREAIMRLERAAFAFAQTGSARDGCAVLIALGEVEAAFARGGRQAQELTPLRRASAASWLQAAADGTLEFSVAAALASLHDPHATHVTPALRDYLHGTLLDEHGQRSYGERHAGLPRNAAPIARLAALHARRHLDAERAGSKHRAASALAFRYGLACPLTAVEALAAGGIDERRVMALLEGLALLDFGGVSWTPGATHPSLPVPVLRLLLLAWSGTRDVPLAPRPGWAARLAAGDIGFVLRDALLRLRLAGLVPLADHRDLQWRREQGPRLAAALLLHTSARERAALARTLIQRPTSIEEGDDHAQSA